jgi:hypothetical protein
MATHRAPHTPAAVGFFGVASGTALLTFIGLGFLLARVLPPPGPYSASVTAAYYHSDIDVKRLGVILIIVGGTMFLPFGAAVADRLRHVEGIGPVAAITEFGAAVISAALMMVFGSLTGSLIPFFTFGPFTWNGFISFWIAGAIFFAWYIILLVQLAKNYRHTRAQRTTQPPRSEHLHDRAADTVAGVMEATR